MAQCASHNEGAGQSFCSNSKCKPAHGVTPAAARRAAPSTMRTFATATAALACVAASQAGAVPTCQCSDPSLCKPLAGPPAASRELFMFATAAQTNWEQYPWDSLTTVAVAGWDGVTSEMVCHAHTSNTRVVILTSMSKQQVPNRTARAEWIAETMDQVAQAGLDGVNVDFEDYVLPDDTATRNGLVDLTKELRTAIDEQGRSRGGAMQLSWDFAWSPDGQGGGCGVDERCYPYQQLAAIVDIGFVMAYDMRSQVFAPGPCTAWANSPKPLVEAGLRNWTNIASPNKLVLGLPLYGYKYPCLNGTLPTSKDCRIPTTHWRNATCSGECPALSCDPLHLKLQSQRRLPQSRCDVPCWLPARHLHAVADAVGREHDMSEVEPWIKGSSTGWQWDSESETPWFNVVDSDGSVNQVWFDNPASLALKANLAGLMGLRGTGAWEMDAVFGRGMASSLTSAYLHALSAF